MVGGGARPRAGQARRRPRLAPRNKKLSTPLALALLFLFLGYFARVQHWSYGFEMNLIALVSLGVLYVARYALKSNRNLKDLAKVLMISSWVTVMIWGQLKFGRMPYLVNATLLLGLIWFVLEIIDLIKPKETNDKINPVLWIGILFMILYVLIQVMYWPFGSITYLVGTLISSIGFFKEYALGRKK